MQGNLSIPWQMYKLPVSGRCAATPVTSVAIYPYIQWGILWRMLLLESRDRVPGFFCCQRFLLTWIYHKQKWLIQILGLKLSQNRSQDHFGTWYAHVKKIFDKRKKAWKKLALHRGSTGFRSQIWQQTHMHGAVLVEPNYIELHKLWYCVECLSKNWSCVVLRTVLPTT